MFFASFLRALCGLAVSFLVLHIAGFGQCVHELTILRYEYASAKGIGIKRYLLIRLSLIGNERYLELFGFLKDIGLLEFRLPDPLSESGTSLSRGQVLDCRLWH